MSRSFQVFLAERPDVWAILDPLGWERAGPSPMSDREPDRFDLEGRDWRAFVWGPSRMSFEDAPPQANAMQPGISWHVAISVDGSEKGLNRVMRAVRAIAKTGPGLIADERNLWRPGSSQRTRWRFPPTPLSSEREWLTLIWWTVDSSLGTVPGAGTFVETLRRVLPEAMPVRWGDTEPFSQSLEHEGEEGLARFIQQRLITHDAPHTKVHPPFRILSIHSAGLLGTESTLYDPTALRIEVGGSILHQAGGGSRLAAAFREISQVLRPFYAEARFEQIVEWNQDEPVIGGVPPINDWCWNGFPRVAPMAMVIGRPYTTHWRGGGGNVDHGMIFYTSDAWPDPPLGGVPIAAEELLQEFDPRAVTTPTSSWGEYPKATPPVWPFH
jgi:hypothetical protein